MFTDCAPGLVPQGRSSPPPSPLSPPAVDGNSDADTTSGQIYFLPKTEVFDFFAIFKALSNVTKWLTFQKCRIIFSICLASKRMQEKSGLRLTRFKCRAVGGGEGNSPPPKPTFLNPSKRLIISHKQSLKFLGPNSWIFASNLPASPNTI